MVEVYYWARVEFIETCGVQLWHILAKLSSVLNTLPSRIIQNFTWPVNNMREHKSWERVSSMGDSGSRSSGKQVCDTFADSISQASFYSEHMDVDSHDLGKVINVNNLRQEFIQKY